MDMGLKLVLLCLFIAGSYSLSSGQESNKEIVITGTVRDGNHNPVKGAAVFIDRIKTGSVTDENGYFTVRVSPHAREIMVFDLSYGASAKLINRRDSIDMSLPGRKVKDIYVNIGYGAVPKKQATSQIGQIDGQKPEFSTYSSIFDMIRGRLPGVEVTGNSIRISGSSSLNVSTEPLFVVNGIIVNSIEHIAPHDVSRIEVLKGPAASVYGIKGSNGVILITLMSGKER
jgi:TonB-dependent SusC/RagA subfamily outer membrane receptor